MSGVAMSRSRSCSPLRYPGGKQGLARVLARLVADNGASGGTYIEAYAGGAGAALNLLFDERVDRIVINDADPSVYAFWRAVLDHIDAFTDLVESTPVSIAEWRRQRAIYRAGGRYGVLRRGFATFFLNRCNRSGIIATGGPIGGIKQTGKWKINARFNREDLIYRLRRVASYRDRIVATNLDALDFLGAAVKGSYGQVDQIFGYLDPPYFAKGEELYMNHYKPGDHASLAKCVAGRLSFPWVMSYDDVAQIRSLYRRHRTVPLRLDYTARERRRGSEILILPPGLSFPSEWRKGIPLAKINRGAYPAR